MFQNTRQIIMKVTRGCNLSCKYCYLFDKEKYSDEQMSDEVFDFLIRRWLSETKAGNYIEGIRDQPIELVFHGGEALLIGKQKFVRFLKKAYQYAKYYKKHLRVSVQTNTTLIDEEWMEIFKTWNIEPGISFDGIFFDEDYRNSAKTVFQKIIDMQGRGISPGVLMVLHKGNYLHMSENFEKLRSIGINSVKVNRAVDVSPTSNVELSVEQLMVATKDMCQYMFSCKGTFVEKSLLDRMRLFLQSYSDRYHQVRNDESDHCYSRFCGGLKNIMEIEPDGTFHFCGRISKRNAITSGGTIFDKDVCEIQESYKQWMFLKSRMNSIQKNRCNECVAQHMCDSGCIAFSHQKYDEPQVDPITCGYFKELHKYFIKNHAFVNTYMEDCIREKLTGNYKEDDEYARNDGVKS